MIDCCPECGTSQIHERKTKKPAYRCLNGHTFERPNQRPKQNRKYTEDELLEHLRQLADSLDRVPRKKDMNEHGKHGARSYKLRFGSWSKAVEAAGFTPHERIDDPQERPSECPLCESATAGLDFHHWRYGERELGCYLCRGCHDAIHEGKGNTENTDWLKYAVENLVRRHLEHHGSGDTSEIRDRYNLPEVDILVEKSLEKHTG